MASGSSSRLLNKRFRLRLTVVIVIVVATFISIFRGDSEALAERVIQGDFECLRHCGGSVLIVRQYLPIRLRSYSRLLALGEMLSCRCELGCGLVPTGLPLIEVGWSWRLLLTALLLETLSVEERLVLGTIT